MLSTRRLHVPITHNIRLFRWAIPAVLSALGFAYIIWDSVFSDGYPINSPRVLIGLVSLGIVGPFVAFGTLTWAVRAFESWERAKYARERQERQLRALNTIGEAVNQSLEIETVLKGAMDRVLEVMQLESGEVRLIENDQLILRTWRGVSTEFIAAEATLPLGQCLCGKSAQRGELIAVEDLERLPEYTRSVCACERFRAVLCVPVRTTERVVGVIHVASQAPRAFDSADRSLLTAVGYQVGVAIEKAQLHAQLKSLNQELEARVSERTRELLAAKEALAQKADALHQILIEERRVEEKTRARIANDLHDGMQQLIIGALYETQAARDALAVNPEMAPARISAAQDLLRRIDSEMRHAIYSLRPFTLDTQGLAPAVRECVASFERVSKVKCDLQIEGTPRRLKSDVEVAAFRTIQEALNNIEAHAQAKCAQVRVDFGTRKLGVEIADDGGGFEADAISRKTRNHLGLIGMQERAESVGGRLVIQSRVGAGTHVILDVPIDSEG